MDVGRIPRLATHGARLIDRGEDPGCWARVLAVTVSSSDRAYSFVMRFFTSKPDVVPTPAEALPGRPDPITVPGVHRILGTPLAGPWPDGTQTAIFGLGCFWGAEKAFWQLPGVVTTAVGYAGGSTPNPTYEESCTGRTGHAEVVLVAFDPSKISYEQLLKTFWEDHDPTQKMRQGNDVGTQYRSIILTADDEQRADRRGLDATSSRACCRPRATAPSPPRS